MVVVVISIDFSFFDINECVRSDDPIFNCIKWY